MCRVGDAIAIVTTACRTGRLRSGSVPAMRRLPPGPMRSVYGRSGDWVIRNPSAASVDHETETSHVRYALAALCLAVSASASQGALVTYQATGTFDDGADWTATATFEESAMAGMKVFISEMTLFEWVTQVSPTNPGDFPGTTYTAGDSFDPASDGLSFDGTMAGALVTGSATNPGDGASSFYFFGGALGSEITEANALEFSSSDDRSDFTDPVWTFIPSATVPEPASALVVGLVAAPLLLRRKRRVG